MKSETKNVLLISLLASFILLLAAFGVRKYLNQFPQVAPIGVSAIPSTDVGKRALLNSFNPATSSPQTSMLKEEEKAKLDLFMPAASSATSEKSDEEKLKKLNAFTH